MDAFLPPLVAALGFSLYFVLLLLHVPLYRRVPWEFLAIVIAASTFAVYGLVAGPSVATAVGAALSLGILGFATWFFLSFSMYEAREDRPRVGERFPDFTLPASDGATFSLGDVRRRRLLLICYRGDW